MRLDQNEISPENGKFAGWQSATTTGTDQRRSWPDSVAFREAIQSPSSSIADPELSSASVAIDRLGMPLSYSGRFAIVFRLSTEQGVRWALRCFTSPGEDGRGAARANRYQIITQYANRMNNTFVPFRYIERGIRIGSVWYPIVAMRWANGEPLGRWVEANLSNPDALRTLCGSLSGLLERLEDAGIAHGDWQHDNLLISDNGGRVTVVDYDGMFVPEFAGMPCPEIGHPNYQHPDRTTAHFGVGLDRFACLVIETALLALAHEPSLWSRFADGESLLFKQADFRDPENSPVFQAVRAVAKEKQDADLAETLLRLEDACHAGAQSTLLPAVAPGPAPESFFADEAKRRAALSEAARQAEAAAPRQIPLPPLGNHKWWQIPENAGALSGGRRRTRSGFAGATNAAVAPVQAGNEYLARIEKPETRREEMWHLLRWRLGGAAINAFMFAELYQHFFRHDHYRLWMFLWVLNFAGFGYGRWPRRRIQEDLSSEIAKMENLVADRKRRIQNKGGVALPADVTLFIAERLRQTSVANIIAVSGTSATIRILRAAGINNMQEFRERYTEQRIRSHLPPEQITALARWCEELEMNAADDYRKRTASMRTIPVEVERLRHELAEFERHAAELKRERGQFPDTSFFAYLRKLVGFGEPLTAATKPGSPPHP